MEVQNVERRWSAFFTELGFPFLPTLTFLILTLISCSSPSDDYPIPPAVRGLDVAYIELYEDRDVDRVADILSHSAHPGIAVQYRQAGGFDLPKTNYLIDTLFNKYNKNFVTLTIYADCGPCRYPRRPKGVFDIIRSDFDIYTFNKHLENKSKFFLDRLEAEFIQIREALPKMREGLTIKWSYLEDNYSDKGYEVIDSVAKKVFADREIFYVRNKNGDALKLNYSDEIHTHNYFYIDALEPWDQLTSDGEVICLPDSIACEGEELADIIAIAKRVNAIGAGYYAWFPEMKGLLPGNRWVENSHESPFERKQKGRFNIPDDLSLIALMED